MTNIENKPRKKLFRYFLYTFAGIVGTVISIVNVTVFVIISIYGIYYMINPEEEYRSLGNKYYYYFQQQSVKGEYLAIPPYIEDWEDNGNYFIARQNPKGNKPKKFYNNIEYDFSEGLNADYYWVIDIDGQQSYGPMDSLSFRQMCDSLKINKDYYSEIFPKENNK